MRGRTKAAHSPIARNPLALTLVSYAGVVWAAVAVFAVTLFASTAIGDGRSAYTYPLHHWFIAGGAAAGVMAVLLVGVHVLLTDVRRRSGR
ncbi:hypothetical protein [Williamsia herbipolensis]|uniref:hypothetical protein n=1 Tax=Williamsia herbipolensis TaxID=1603258 RepID=UPI0005F7F7C5|nr:hypothetical protein [Williamsia herbipolensis]